jgi:hypothetical protein
MATKKKVAQKTTATTKKPSVKKATAKTTPPKKATAKTATAKNATATTKKVTAAKAPAKKMGPRADHGAPIDGYFAKQPQPQRGHLERLRALVEQVAPDATTAIKWGAPFFLMGDAMAISLGAFKAHSKINFFVPRGVLDDPRGRLEGDSENARSLRIVTDADIDDAQIVRWAKATVAHHRR